MICNDMHNAAQKRSANLLSYLPGNHHSADVVYLKGGGVSTVYQKHRERLTTVITLYTTCDSECQHRMPAAATLLTCLILCVLQQ